MMLSKFRLQALAVMALTGCGVFQFGEFAPRDRPASDAGVSDGSHDQHTSGDMGSQRPCQEDEQGGAYRVLACWEITSASHPICTPDETNWHSLDQDWGFNNSLGVAGYSRCNAQIDPKIRSNDKELFLKIKHKVSIPRFGSSSLDNMYVFNLSARFDRLMPDAGNLYIIQIEQWKYHNIPYSIDTIPFPNTPGEALTEIIFQVDGPSSVPPTAAATWDMQRISIVECVSPGNCP